MVRQANTEFRTHVVRGTINMSQFDPDEIGTVTLNDGETVTLDAEVLAYHQTRTDLCGWAWEIPEFEEFDTSTSRAVTDRAIAAGWDQTTHLTVEMPSDVCFGRTSLAMLEKEFDFVLVSPYQNLGTLFIGLNWREEPS